MWHSGNYVELNITKNDAHTGSHQGQCIDDIRGLLQKPYIRRQFDKLDPERIKTELYEYGAWTDEELEDKEDNKERLLWIFCSDIVEGKN